MTMALTRERGHVSDDDDDDDEYIFGTRREKRYIVGTKESSILWAVNDDPENHNCFFIALAPHEFIDHIKALRDRTKLARFIPAFPPEGFPFAQSPRQRDRRSTTFRGVQPPPSVSHSSIEFRGVDKSIRRPSLYPDDSMPFLPTPCVKPGDLASPRTRPTEDFQKDQQLAALGVDDTPGPPQKDAMRYDGILLDNFQQMLQCDDFAGLFNLLKEGSLEVIICVARSDIRAGSELFVEYGMHHPGATNLCKLKSQETLVKYQDWKNDDEWHVGVFEEVKIIDETQMVELKWAKPYRKFRNLMMSMQDFETKRLTVGRTLPYVV